MVRAKLLDKPDNIIPVWYSTLKEIRKKRYGIMDTNGDWDFEVHDWTAFALISFVVCRVVRTEHR